MTPICISKSSQHWEKHSYVFKSKGLIKSPYMNVFSHISRICFPSAFGKSNVQEPSLGSHVIINQSEFLIISLQHSGCAAKLGWSPEFGFPPVHIGTSKADYNIAPLLGAARASSFVQTDRRRSGSRVKGAGISALSSSHPNFCLLNC